MCDTCEWDVYLKTINEMCESDDYAFINDRLANIGNAVEKNRHITDRQIDIVTGIRKAVEGNKLRAFRYVIEHAGRRDYVFVGAEDRQEADIMALAGHRKSHPEGGERKILSVTEEEI
jgi:hypothetical protein